MRYWRTRFLGMGGLLWLTIVCCAAPALADDKSPAKAGVLNVLDQQDSKGIWVSQYQLYVDEGNITSFDKQINALLLIPLWELYRWSTSMTSMLLDYVVTLEWVTLIAAPLDYLAQQLRTHVMAPLGMTGFGQGGVLALLITIAACFGGWKVLRGEAAAGIRQLATSALMSALAVGVFAAPFAAVVGDSAGLSKPLRYAQQVGAHTSHLIVSGTVPNKQDTTQPQAPELGRIYLDSMIRPIHQGVNFGTNLDRDDPRCAVVYDQALTQGPFAVGDSKPRDVIGGCNQAYAEFASGVTPVWFLTLTALSGAGFTLLVLTILFVGFTAYTVLQLMTASFRLMFTSLVGIIPGVARGPVLRDLVDIGVNFVYLGVSMIVMAIALAVTRGVLQATASWPLLFQYAMLQFLLLLSCGVVVLNYVWHKRGRASLWQRLIARLGIDDPKPTLATRAAAWAKQPAAGTGPHTGGAPPGAGPAGSDQPSVAERIIQMRQRVADSNGARVTQLVGKGVRLGAEVAVAGGTGGASAVVRGARTAVTVGKAAGQAKQIMDATRAGARRATTGHQGVDKVATTIAASADWAQRTAGTYQAMRGGARRATTGSQAMDRVFHVIGQAHHGADRTAHSLKTHTAATVLSTTLSMATPQAKPHRPGEPPPHQIGGDRRALTRTTSAPAALASSVPARAPAPQDPRTPRELRVTPPRPRTSTAPTSRTAAVAPAQPRPAGQPDRAPTNAATSDTRQAADVAAAILAEQMKRKAGQ